MEEIIFNPAQHKRPLLPYQMIWFAIVGKAQEINISLARVLFYVTVSHPSFRYLHLGFSFTVTGQSVLNLTKKRKKAFEGQQHDRFIHDVFPYVHICPFLSALLWVIFFPTTKKWQMRCSLFTSAEQAGSRKYKYTLSFT